jgi:hypothetical protein
LIHRFHFDLAALGVAGGIGGVMLLAEQVSPEIARNPMTPTFSSAIVLLAFVVLKFVERKWFASNDKKTDSVGQNVLELRNAINDLRDTEAKRIDRLGERMDRLVERVEDISASNAKHAGIAEENARLATMLGRLMQKHEKVERDLRVLHDWRRLSSGLEAVSEPTK